MKRFNSDNCLSKIRRQYTDWLGRKITIVGQHAHKWSIIVEKDNICLMNITFPNRVLCMKEANTKYKEA